MQHTSVVNAHIGKDGTYQKHQNVVLFFLFFLVETQRTWSILQLFVLSLKFVIWE